MPKLDGAIKRLNNRRALCVVLVALACGLMSASPAVGDDPVYGKPIYVEGRDLQTVIDGAPPYATIVCDPGDEIVIDEGGTIVIDKPLKLLNLNARLADDAAGAEILVVTGKDVVIKDFRLTGNYETVGQDDRATLLLVGNDNFRIENGYVAGATRHGIEVRANLKGEDLYDGVVRNIVSRDIQRDTVSINGHGREGIYNWNILVENIWGYNNAYRGVVEVVDGNYNVTVRNVFGDRCLYGVEVHDHRDGPGESQTNIIVEGVYVTNSHQAVSSHQGDYDHINLTIRDVSGDNWWIHPDFPHRRARVDVMYFDNVLLENIRINNNTDIAGVSVRQSKGLVLRDVFVHNHEGVIEHEHIGNETAGNLLAPVFDGETMPAIELVNCSDVLVDGVLVRGGNPAAARLEYRLTGEWGDHRNVQIHNVSSPGAEPAGVVLIRRDEGVTLENYMVSGNLARVLDQIEGPGAMLSNNLE